MKKMLSIIGTISLVGTSTTSLVACNTPQYTEKKLADLKEKNNIKTKDGILEWMAPQEKPFNRADNKWYYIAWRADKWVITKYKNNRYETDKGWIIDDLNNSSHYKLMIRPKAILGAFSDGKWRGWNWGDSSYLKGVYRWNLETQEPNLLIEKDGTIKVKK